MISQNFVIWNNYKIWFLFTHEDKVSFLVILSYGSIYSLYITWMVITMLSPKLFTFSVYNIFQKWCTVIIKDKTNMPTQLRKNSECINHLQEHWNHQFHWSVLSITRNNNFTQKIAEAYFNNTMIPSQIIRWIAIH